MKLRDRVARFFSTGVGKETLEKSVPKYDDSLAYLVNPVALYQASGYKEKYTSLSYDILRKVASRDSVIGSIILTRVHQVSAFTRPARNSPDGIGFRVVPKDSSQKLTEQDEAMILSLEKFIVQMGYNKDPKRDSFNKFLKKFVRDSLTYDQACFEIIPDKRGYPAEVVCVDASTIRVVSDEDRVVAERNSRDKADLSYVQVIDGTIYSTFSADELAFCIRNPRSDVRLTEYGYSEIEQLITQITSHLYAEEYNSRYFSQGGTTKGILNLKTAGTGKDAVPSQVQNAQLEAFRAQWQAQVSGLTGAWKTPVLQVPNGIEYINVSQSNREMEFEKWMNYLVNICCSIYQIDPAEINFPNNGGVGGNQHSLLDSGTEGKLKYSKDKGLRPLLRFIEDCITKYIIERFSDDYVFVFEGLDSSKEDEIIERASKEIRSFKTLNEVRHDFGLPEIEGGHLILDPSYINYINSKEMMSNQEDEEGEEDYNGEYDEYGINNEGQGEYVSFNDEYEEELDEEDEELYRSLGIIPF